MTKPETGCPSPLYGILQPGERSTRRFSCPLDDNHVPLLQKLTGSVRIAEQSAEEIVVENTGPSTAFFAVWFPTQQGARAVVGIGEVLGFITDRYKGGRR